LDNCAASPLLWKRQDRLVFTVWCGSVHLTTRSELLVFDPGARRFVGRREIGPGSLEGVLTAHGSAALLTPPPLGPSSAGNLREERLGPARLIRVGPSGRADEITLAIRMGSARGRTFNRWPAFAVDSSRRHVYVLGEDDGVVRVDAVTLQAEPARLRHAFAAQPQFASTPRPHLGTTNPARTLERQALWLGGGLLAVTGSDTWSSRGHDRSAPAGLKLVDTGHWSVRLLNPLISTVTRAPGGFLATGPGAGVVAYDRKGHVRWRRFAHKFVWVVRVSGHRARVAVGDNENGSSREAVIDLPR
jgi:hypothetical protein